MGAPQRHGSELDGLKLVLTMNSWSTNRVSTRAVLVGPGALRGLGLSRRKAATVRDLAQRFGDGRLSEAELRQLPDQEVIRRRSSADQRPARLHAKLRRL